MDRLDLRLVFYFVAVAEELHFGRAADRLHIAQPSLSQQIRRLEQQLGVTLLTRTSRNVELTASGQVLLREGRRMLNQSQRTIQSVRAAGAEHLVVGFFGSAGNTLLPEVLRAHAERHPDMHVSLRELGLDDTDNLRDGRVDVAFARLLPDQTDLEIEVLADEPRVVVLPVSHRLARRPSLVFDDLRDEAFITNPMTTASDPPARWLAEQRRHGLPARVAAKAATVQEILALVASGRGVCLVPESVARDYPRADLRYVEVADADRAVLSIAWSQASNSAAVAAFVQAARRTATASVRRARGNRTRRGAKRGAI